MAKNLVIVESPAKAKTIGKYLGKQFTVKASLGHVKDLPKKNLSVDVDNDFRPIYEVIEGKKKLIGELKSEAKKADNIYLAADPDREGEAISWHLANILNIEEKDKKHINNMEKNIFTLACNSSNREEVYKLMDWYGHETVDFFFVDGWHSVNQCLEDWKYWEKMSPTGVMAFHDTNYHPGPVALLDAVDEKIFDIKLFNRDEDDAGVAYVKRRG